jgi:hypothetical protein
MRRTAVAASEKTLKRTDECSAKMRKAIAGKADLLGNVFENSKGSWECVAAGRRLDKSSWRLWLRYAR